MFVICVNSFVLNIPFKPNILAVDGSFFLDIVIGLIVESDDVDYDDDNDGVRWISVNKIKQ